MGAVTFRYYYVFHDTNQPSYDPGLTSRCGWTAKTNPPPSLSLSLRVWPISCIGKILVYFVPGRPVNSSSFHPSSGCHRATHFMLAHKAVLHGCRQLSLLLCGSRYQLAQL